MPSAQGLPRPSVDPAGGVELVRFAESLLAASSLEQLERRFLTGFGRVMGVEMHGYDLVDPVTGDPTFVAAANVSDVFLASYERSARDVDPVLANAFATGRPAYNMALMDADEWVDTEVYRRAYRLHGVRHVVEVPVPNAGQIVGNLHFAVSDPAREFAPSEIRAAEAVAHVLGTAVAGIHTREQAAREREQVLAALELTGTAIVISEPGATELRLNQAARRLLGEVVDAEEWLHQLVARPLTSGGFSRRLDIELVTGEVGVLHAQALPARHDHSALVAVLELEREKPGIAPGALAALTPRESDVAVLVVDGLSDREIASRLCLSRYTVSQYVKRIYRKLDVDSRVGLTRLLLGHHRSRGSLEVGMGRTLPN